jgi:hypothetical protein
VLSKTSSWNSIGRKYKQQSKEPRKRLLQRRRRGSVTDRAQSVHPASKSLYKANNQIERSGKDYDKGCICGRMNQSYKENNDVGHTEAHRGPTKTLNIQEHND